MVFFRATELEYLSFGDRKAALGYLYRRASLHNGEIVICCFKGYDIATLSRLLGTRKELEAGSR